MKTRLFFCVFFAFWALSSVEGLSAQVHVGRDTAFSVHGGEPVSRRYAVSMNFADWANIGTMNASFLVSASRRSSFGGSFRYNPWKIDKGKPSQKGYNLFSVEADYRFWPWHVYSGWWFLADAQYRKYNVTDWLWRKHSEQGRAYGAGIGVGYAYMIGEHWNVEAGAAFWGGYKDYKKYQCGSCGVLIGEGKKAFVEPDRVFINFSYIF